MSQKTATNYVRLVDYRELEENILSSIREGRPLTGRDEALTPFIKKLLEAGLEGEMKNHLSNNEEDEDNRRNGKSSKTLRTSSGSFELLIPSPVSNETNEKGLFLPIIGELSKFITCPICFPNNEYWYNAKGSRRKL